MESEILTEAMKWGFERFLIVLFVLGIGYAGWNIGNRISRALEKAYERLADSTARTADAIQSTSRTLGEITEMNRAIKERSEENSQLNKNQVTAMGALQEQHDHQKRALYHTICALHEAHDNPKVRAFLERAKTLLETR